MRCCITLLEKVNEPSDVKRLTEAQLLQLASEIRTFLIESVSKTGGHFGANLGVVELTLALHRVFDSPRDKIVWDVGHQAYVHKMLTGRREQFATLRQYKGLSGFPKRSESPHDAFGAGHASTSISAALGMAVARDLSGERHHVVAVIGDGALTGGMAMEALNHAGHLGTNLLVILNDNEMSISENVGAVSKYLTRLRTDPTYSRAKAELEAALRKVPAIGERLTKTLERFKDSMRHLFVPGMWFEGFGFKYLGPVDGHDLPGLIRVLEDAKHLRGPVLIHLVTRKGKGYPSAEDAPDKFHAWPSGSGGKAAPSYSSVFAETLTRLAEADERVVAVTPAMIQGSGLGKFQQKFPRRLYDVGIAEQHAATFCAGLAAAGKRPVLAIYSTFLQRAYDQVIHDICIQKLPVLIAIDRAGLVGADGETHQGAFDIAYLRTVPNLTLMMPKDENELRHMLYTGLQLEGPVAVRYPRADGEGVPLDESLRMLPVGRAEVVREGSDVALLALGPMVRVAEAAAERLADQHGIQATVVNMRFVKPLDHALVVRLAERMPLVTVEEAALAGGMGSAVMEALADAGVLSPVTRMGLPDVFVEHGSREELLMAFQLSPEGVADAALRTVRAAQRGRRVEV
ncbi:1-deoxy-D-xylulose-5-phosphate synthase [Alicyclobacillus macrosporangiidus]|uniref:1-deoxy-D-xylulose-5-phosphate synthase n=1 Tax=Alicyclobacillus macrosporangiidus TaxID=392015 RepID=A0A1I7JY74_9BACL|nr:1-deoxy-D-xylulose-5-phosphate synthase [Alicyclobacillus macrosporangiidus]SFU90104.1 1-deoxy-D-xylulose-5-phosphate synthase [Alicyclobacillus macrosporangiidus]